MAQLSMKKATVFVLFASLAHWLAIHVTHVNAISEPLQQCSCTGDLFLPRGSPQLQTEIVITALFSFEGCNNPQASGSVATYHLIPAAVLAVEEINNSSDILNNFHVSLDIRDTQCDSALVIYQLMQSVQDRAAMNATPPANSLNLAILGPGCTEVSQAIAGLAGRRLNMSEVSYGYNSPLLANRTGFPSFFQTVRSIDLTTISARRLLSHLNWTNNVGVICETSSIYRQDREKFILTVDGNFTFRNGGTNSTMVCIKRLTQIPEFDTRADQPLIREFMTGVVDDKIRVIVAIVSERIASLLLCMTRNVTIPSDGFLFVFVGSLSEDWWRDDRYCKLEAREVESVIIVSSEPVVLDSSVILPSGKTINDFKRDYSSRLSSWCPTTSEPISPDPLAAATYDAVWSIAYALDDNLDLLTVNNTDNYQYNPVIYKAVKMSLHSTDFNGATGQVQFSKKGQRIGVDIILQMQNGTRVPVGKFKPNSEEFIGVNTCLEGEICLDGQFRWFGMTNETPSDMPRIIPKAVPLYVLIISMVFTVTGMIFACSMWCFNWRYGKHKILLASSQKLNYVIIAGTFFAYLTVVILSILESPLGLLMSDVLFKAICIIRIWILPLAFTMSYGTMLARAWRIYRIFNDPWVTNRPLRDYHLIMIVVALGMADLLYLIPWTIIDPYRRTELLDDINYAEYSRCSSLSCSSDNVIVWLGILSLYKFLVMLAGVLIISLVRKNVNKKKYFNDATSLATALYVTALSFFIGVPIQLIFTFQRRITISYIAAATWVNIASSGTLIGVFMPKVYAICVKHDKGKKYKTEKSIFYLQHPEVSRPIEDRSDSVASLSGIHSINQTIVCDITETDIGNITGTK